MTKALIIAKYTFKELIKSKVMFLSFWLSLAVLVITYVTSEFSYGAPQKIAIDFGLGASSWACVGIALFMGVSLISQEVETRTIYISLARPVSRTSFILGKILGMALVLILNILIINSVSMLNYFYYGGTFSSLLFYAIVFSFFESFLVLLVVVLFSMVTNITISIINTIIIFFIGHSISASLEIGFVKRSLLLPKIIKAYSYIIPNFDKINIKDFIIYKSSLEFSYIAGSLLYCIIYSTALLSIMIYTFNRKELE